MISAVDPQQSFANLLGISEKRQIETYTKLLLAMHWLENG